MPHQCAQALAKKRDEIVKADLQDKCRVDNDGCVIFDIQTYRDLSAAAFHSLNQVDTDANKQVFEQIQSQQNSPTDTNQTQGKGEGDWVLIVGAQVVRFCHCRADALAFGTEYTIDFPFALFVKQLESKNV